MTGLESHYRKVDETILIEIKLTSVMQIFDSMDPAPFYEKAIDKNADEYITGAVTDFPLSTPQKLVIFVPDGDMKTEEAQELGKAIHNHFAYKSMVAERDLRQKLLRGRISLVIALLFLATCLAIRYALAASFEDNVWTGLLREGLLIIGWVAMWEPVNIFLYGWWPLVRERRVFEKVRTMEVEVVPYVAVPMEWEAVPNLSFGD
jgi:hypothetical protein